MGPDGTTTLYIFAGSQRIAAVTSSLQPRASSVRFYHGDPLGSSNVITAGSRALVELAENTPYGSLSHHEGSANVPQKFTGKRLDTTGLYFYEARYYDPTLGRFIQADTIVPVPGDPQALNRYSYVRNNPLRYTDPTGHSWKKFWNSFAGAFVGAVVTVLTAGAGAPLWIAAMAGGMMGGALSGGLGGGWKGALMGGAMGGALGAFGGWGVSTFGAGFGVGMLAAGAGVAGATNSWDSFAGGVVGGVAGAFTGNQIVQSEQFQNWKHDEGFLSNREVRANHYRQDIEQIRALSVKANDRTTVTVGSRAVEGPVKAGHRYIAPNDNRFEMGPLRQAGREPIVTSNTTDVSTWATSRATQSAIAAGLARTTPVNVSTSGFVTSMGLYEAYFGGQQYNAFSYNSNFAVNSVIYGAGGLEVKNLGYTPGFPDN